MFDLLSAASTLVAVGFTFYVLASRLCGRRVCAQLTGRRRVLLVSAHPDDECMFFGPTVLGLLRQPGCCLYLLCLSTGDHEGRGRQRRDELYRSCAMLGLRDDRLILVRHTRLPDDPRLLWNDRLVAELVLHHAVTLDVQAVLSFDRLGVSLHRNHRSIYYALARLVGERRLPPDCTAFVLPTVNRLRKYSAFLDVPWSLVLGGRSTFVAPLADWRRIQRAMAEHRSQLLWYRRLYMVFSRYVFVNTLVQLSVEMSQRTSLDTDEPVSDDVDSADSYDLADNSTAEKVGGRLGFGDGPIDRRVIEESLESSRTVHDIR